MASTRVRQKCDEREHQLHYVVWATQTEDTKRGELKQAPSRRQYSLQETGEKLRRGAMRTL